MYNLSQNNQVESLCTTTDMQRLRSQLALAAFLRDLGEAVEEAELVIWRHT